MEITIVGAGAIGLLWGTHLSPFHHVHYWTRDQASSLNIVLDLKNAPTVLASSHHTFAANQPDRIRQADCVLVTVKAFQGKQALQTVAPYLSPKTPVIIMHNGMGTHDAVKALLPEQPLLYATTAQAAFRAHRHHVQHTGHGATWLGAMNPQGEAHHALAELLHRALPPCQWHANIMQPLWQKLAINCAINPLTAIHQCRNGALAQPPFDTVLTHVCQEVAAVMCAEGLPTEAIALREQVDKVIHATAMNFSSMHQDVSHHRMTEIDYITGYLLARAKAHHLAAPANTQLWQQVKQLEQHNHDA